MKVLSVIFILSILFLVSCVNKEYSTVRHTTQPTIQNSRSSDSNVFKFSNRLTAVGTKTNNLNELDLIEIYENGEFNTLNKNKSVKISNIFQFRNGIGIKSFVDDENSKDKYWLFTVITKDKKEWSIKKSLVEASNGITPILESDYGIIVFDDNTNFNLNSGEFSKVESAINFNNYFNNYLKNIVGNLLVLYNAIGNYYFDLSTKTRWVGNVPTIYLGDNKYITIEYPDKNSGVLTLTRDNCFILNTVNGMNEKCKNENHIYAFNKLIYQYQNIVVLKDSNANEISIYNTQDDTITKSGIINVSVDVSVPQHTLLGNENSFFTKKYGSS